MPVPFTDYCKHRQVSGQQFVKMKASSVHSKSTQNLNTTGFMLDAKRLGNYRLFEHCEGEKSMSSRVLGRS